MLPRTRAPIIALAAASVCLLALLGMSFWLGAPFSSRDNAAAVAIGGPFNLVNQKGEPISEKTFLGKPTLYFFGFTHCPEVCPTTLQDMTSLLAKLGPDGDRVNAVFVSLDPERDTKELLAAYLDNFDPRIVGATGAPADIAAMAKLFHVYYRKVEENGDYTIDHTAAIYLMDANGAFATLINYKEELESALKKARLLL